MCDRCEMNAGMNFLLRFLKSRQQVWEQSMLDLVISIESGQLNNLRQVHCAKSDTIVLNRVNLMLSYLIRKPFPYTQIQHSYIAQNLTHFTQQSQPDALILIRKPFPYTQI